NSPARTGVAMQAATAFLLADQIAPAVDILSRLRARAGVDDGIRLEGMLKALGAVSNEARSALKHPASTEADSAPIAANARIRELVGQLTTPEMERLSETAPPLLNDTSYITPMPDPELAAGGELDLLSTESVYAEYRKIAARSATGRLPEVPQPPVEAASATPAPPAAAGARFAPVISPLSLPAERPAAARQPAPPPSTTPERFAPLPPVQTRSSVPPAETPPAPVEIITVAPPVTIRSAPAAPLPPPERTGTEVPVPISSVPSGASVVFDNRQSFGCVAPCQMPLTPERHTLRANLGGYREALKIFVVDRKNPQAVEVTLVAKTGVVTVESQPPGSPIVLNGQKPGYSTPARLKLPEGEHEIGVEINGKTQLQKVIVRDQDLGRIVF
ncbi:MAG: PEGA domain-containing protein, partial [Acidobacteria bacterium]|nr:PEGA domain-containing protein [Acidobacteriota bacterium]